MINVWIYEILFFEVFFCVLMWVKVFCLFIIFVFLFYWFGVMLLMGNVGLVLVMVFVNVVFFELSWVFWLFLVKFEFFFDVVCVN